MSRSMSRLIPAALTAAVALLAACGGEDAATTDGAVVAEGTPAATAETAAPAAGAEQTAASSVPTGPTTDLSPNELGRIMVLEYHRIGDNEGEWVRSAANFRKDLQTLYEKGYRPVTMKQVASGDIDIPAGTTPVVFTIDDSSKGQFYYRPDGSIDPNTMAGMWANFQKENPAWHNGAVWCVLPAAEHPSNFFSEKKDRDFASREEREANIKKKVTYLVENRHELCNHTLYHARLDRGTDAQVQEWMARGNDSIKVYTPEGYEVSTMALPLGMWPKNRSLAWQGSHNGKSYSHDVVLEVSGGPNVSPFHRQWDPRSVDRLIVAPGALERQLQKWETDPSDRYVSDGDPRTVSFPQSRQGDLNQARLGGRTARPVSGAAAPAGQQPAAAQPQTR